MAGRDPALEAVLEQIRRDLAQITIAPLRSKAIRTLGTVAAAIVHPYKAIDRAFGPDPDEQQDESPRPRPLTAITGGKPKGNGEPR